MATALEELRQKATEKAERAKVRMRERYQYAISLGFTSTEAQIMSGWSKERIIQVAKEIFNV